MRADWHAGMPFAEPPVRLGHPRLEPVVSWLLAAERRADDITLLFKGLCEQLVEAGVPIWRSVILFSTLHPLYPGHNYFWHAGQDVELVRRDHDFDQSPMMVHSPYRESLDRNADLTYRLNQDEPPSLDILRQMQEKGVSEFLSLLVPFAHGTPPGITFATKIHGGFSSEQAALLRAIPPVLAPLLEMRAQNLTAQAILETYLGRRTGGEVMRGAIRRGDIRQIICPILITDLRGFTSKSDRWPASTLLEALDGYFEAVADAVHGVGGEVIKFMGDGVLAIMPLGVDGNPRRACEAALAAAGNALRALGRTNSRRIERHLEALEFGVGIHFGEVAYGNIGSIDRLDFTVIGQAVNIASRIQDLTKVLGRPILLSADVASWLNVPLESLGCHTIRGIERPLELFAPLD